MSRAGEGKSAASMLHPLSATVKPFSTVNDDDLVLLDVDNNAPMVTVTTTRIFPKLP
jgi:hypothetical protein